MKRSPSQDVVLSENIQNVSQSIDNKSEKAELKQVNESIEQEIKKEEEAMDSSVPSK